MRRTLVSLASLGLIMAAQPAYAAEEVNPETPASEALSLFRTIEANVFAHPPSVNPSNSCAYVPVPQAERQRQLKVVNAYRQFADLKPLTLLDENASEWREAQESSISMALQSDIMHGFPSSWPCYTAAGSRSSNESNLSIVWGGTGTPLRNLVLDDRVPSLGHRMWTLHPDYEKFAFGSVMHESTTTMTQVVIPDSVRGSGNEAPATITWPTPGYFPQTEVPDEWSFAARGVSDLSGARVSVTGPDGVTRAVTVSHEPWEYNGIGMANISFRIPGGVSYLDAGELAVYTITVTSGEKTWTYPVRLFGGEPEKGGDNVYLVNNWASTTAHTQFHIPQATQIMAGDFTGDGIDTVATRSDRTVRMFATNAKDPFYSTFVIGRPGDQVLVGDWDGDGVDTVALRRGNTFYITSSNTSAEVTTLTYGRAGDEVLVGDWDGNGTDTLAVRRGNQYFIANSVKSGNADTVIHYGRAADQVLVGDWDGKGGDTLTVRRGRQYYMKNSIATGNADTVLNYGRPTDRVIVGDWDGDGKDTLGVYRP